MAKLGMARRAPTSERSRIISLEQRLDRLEREFDGRVDFGHATDPSGAGADAGATAGGGHNGQIHNVHGSWVRAAFTDTTDLTTGRLFLANHNLNVPVTTLSGINFQNVNWLSFGMFRDELNTGAIPGALFEWAVHYDGSDHASITPNVFPLRIYVDTAVVTVGALTNFGFNFFFAPVEGVQ